MDRILVITYRAPQGLPQPGYLIAEGLRRSGIDVRVLGKAKSSWGRLLEIASSSLLLAPQYDVLLVDVFGHRAFAYESVGILWARLWQKRIVAFLHSGYMPEFVERWPRWARFVLSQPDKILVPHQFLNERLSALGLRIDGTIPNFIKLENYLFRERAVLSPKFLYVRGTHPIYNAPMALRAFALLQQKYPNARLTIAGKDGQDSGLCRSIVHKLGLRNVKFLGVVPKERIPALADEHDIYVQCNRVDNMPISVIEMWACGLPIVATRVGGIPHLVRSGEDGILIDSENYQAMAEACLDLLSNSELARRLSRNGRTRAKDLTWERVKPMWESVLGLKTGLDREVALSRPDMPARPVPESGFHGLAKRDLER